MYDRDRRSRASASSVAGRHGSTGNVDGGLIKRVRTVFA
jgi:hypothetical protein